MQVELLDVIYNIRIDKLSLFIEQNKYKLSIAYNMIECIKSSNFYNPYYMEERLRDIVIDIINNELEEQFISFSS